MNGKLSFCRLVTLFYRMRVLQNTKRFLIYDSLKRVSILNVQSLRLMTSMTFSKMVSWAFFLLAVEDMLH